MYLTDFVVLQWHIIIILFYLQDGLARWKTRGIRPRDFRNARREEGGKLRQQEWHHIREDHYHQLRGDAIIVAASFDSEIRD